MRLAMLAFQQKNVVMAQGDITRSTLEALARPPVENIFLALRRVLTERAAHAGGFLEDGSVQPAPTFLGHDGRRLALPDLVGTATAAMLARLRIQTPADALAFFRRRRPEDFAWLKVAVRFPTPPPVLRTEDGSARPRSIAATSGTTFPSMPRASASPAAHALSLLHPVRRPGAASASRWCAGAPPSAAGAPSWPPTARSTCATRTRTSVGGSGGTSWPRRSGCRRPIRRSPRWSRRSGSTAPSSEVTNYDEVGPGYHSAYGLVAGIHVEARARPGGGTTYQDCGIRTHGSFDYTSLLGRFSHGCHRLHNNLAVRLFSFVLRHRKAARWGPWPSISDGSSGGAARCSTCGCPPGASTSSSIHRCRSRRSRATSRDRRKSRSPATCASRASSTRRVAPPPAGPMGPERRAGGGAREGAEP